MEKFEEIYRRAAERKGGRNVLESMLAKPLSIEELRTIPDDRWLSVFSLKAFQSGISWRVVSNKWPNFEKHFFNFNIEPLLMLSDEQWEIKAQDKSIIRHMTKVMSIRENARMIHEVRLQHGSFANMVATWPSESITDLWVYLKKHGKRLGGNTGPYALRQLGVDTFILSNDVEAYLRNYNVIEGGRDTKRSLKAANEAFVVWQKQSGRSFTEISQIIAFSVGDNRV